MKLSGATTEKWSVNGRGQRMTASKRVPMTEADLMEKPARQRHALTGQLRNDAEAQRFRSVLDSALTHHRFSRNAEARRVVNSLLEGLDTLAPHLTEGVAAHYAPVHTTLEGTARAPADALRVASDNVRRAIGAGDVEGARGYLRVLHT
ncbi:hypothetical protein GCM10010842_15570 [Deinococcus daejeonensis]|uniref:Uncharacterized protein n=2 Tax=Deinococcus daejeonensis TaxID=1007098 RepID=A0ABQ2J0N5_9DEIO|nr:hypothetical protein GCM10010842_15570 [Deinococcus daejeonensis]